VVGAGTGVASYLMTKKHGNPAVRHFRRHSAEEGQAEAFLTRYQRRRMS
jgi:hypothetical protein